MFKNRKIIAVWLAILILPVFGIINYKFNKPLLNTIEHINQKGASYPILNQIAVLTLDRQHETVNGALAESRNFQDKYLFAHRIDHENYSSNYHSELVLSSLDKNFKPETSTVLKLEPMERIRAQDPRIFSLNDQHYLLYNEASKTTKQREMYLASLDLTHEPKIVKTYNLVYEPGKSANQKNWTPLTFNNQIYFIYSINPLIVLKWDEHHNKLNALQTAAAINKLNWQYGEIRGGTPAIFVKELNAYLCFFHSSLQFKENEPAWHVRKEPFWRIYYMGAVLLDSKPPFKVLAYTDKPLTYPGMYSNKERNMHIIFPVGVIQNEECFIISAGLQDSATILLKLDKRDLYKSMVAIK